MLAIILSGSLIYGQTATLRLEMPTTPPAIGEDFMVGVWLDELTYSWDPTIWSAIFAWEYDDAIITPVSTGPPFNRYFHNYDQMFIDYASLPVSSLPATGDLRIFFATGNVYGYDPSFYGFENGITSFKFFDLKFTYHGGDISLQWGTTAKLNPVDGKITDGKLSKTMTEMLAPPPPASGLPYVFTELIGIGDNMWQGDDPTFPTQWDVPENWSDNIVPTTEDVKIMVTSNMPVIPEGVAASCGGLELGAGAMLTIEGSLTAAETIINGDLYLNDGSFIDGGISGDGNFYYKRVTSSYPSGSTDGWHLIASPLATSFTNWDLFDYYVNTWDESGPTYIAHQTPTPPNCAPADEITLAPAEGWSIKFADWYASDICEAIHPGTGIEIDFDGPATDLNTGSQSIAVSFTNNLSGFDGYNLVGNPYPSSIDADEIIFSEDLDGTINIWNFMANKQYYEWTTAIGSQLIAPTQAFFIRAFAETTFNLAGSERAHGGMFSKETIDDLLKLSVTGNDSYDETFVRFVEGTSTGYDLHLDANKLFGSADLPGLYTTSGGQQLAIDVQPGAAQVPLSFTTTTPGLYSIEAFETSQFASIYLQDLQTGTLTNLFEGAHEFTHTDGVQNFIIHFAPVGINHFSSNTVKVWALDNNIIVNVPAEITGEIAIYNMMGQEVVRTDIESIETQIPVSDINTHYIVKVISDNNTVSCKVFVK